MSLALTLLAGCWPYIPGTWEDYAVPEGTQAMGHVEWIEPLGGYWEDNTAYGTAWWGWLDPLDTEHSAWDLAYLTEGCTTAGVDPAWLEGKLAPVDDETSTLSGDPSLVLDWARRDNRFYADLGDEPSGTYHLEPVHVGGETYAGADTLVMPDPVEWNTSLFDGQTTQTITEDQLATVKWKPSDDDSLYAIVRLLVARDDTAVESLQCGAPLASGKLELELGKLEELRGSDYVIVLLGVARETESVLDPSGTTSRFLGARHVEGAVMID